MACAALPSTGSSTSTFAPWVSIDSACDCCCAASWFEFAYSSLQLEQSAFSFAAKYGWSKASWRFVSASGSSRPIEPLFELPPPPPELFLFEVPQAPTATARASTDTAATIRRLLRSSPENAGDSPPPGSPRPSPRRAQGEPQPARLEAVCQELVVINP